MRRTTKTRVVAVATSAVLALGLSPALTAAAAPGGGGHAGGGGSGGDGSGDDTTGSLYADLVKILRDVHGVPILATYDVVGEDGTTTELCVQPVSDVLLPGMTEADAVENPADGRTVYLVPLLGEGLVDVPSTRPRRRPRRSRRATPTRRTPCTSARPSSSASTWRGSPRRTWTGTSPR